MSFTDYVIKENVISAEKIVVDFQDFLDFVNGWFKDNGYDKNEKVHLALPKGKTQIKLIFVKKPDDYNKYEIEFKPTFSPKEQATKKGRTLGRGGLKIIYKAKLIRDYDNKWTSAWRFTLRAIYDRFLIDKKEKYALRGLTEELNHLDQAVRDYLGI